MAAITLKALMKEVGVCPEKLNESISDDHLRAIAILLTSWRKFATYLGLSENDLDDVEQEGRDEQDRRLKALQKWKGKFGFEATYRKLVEVLLSLAMADVAQNVCRLLKGTVLYFLCTSIASFLALANDCTNIRKFGTSDIERHPCICIAYRRSGTLKIIRVKIFCIAID